jgi:hypothetical protein
MLVAWGHIDTDREGITGIICVECLKRIIDCSECVMEVAFRRKEKKGATLGNQRSRADAQEVRQTAYQALKALPGRVPEILDRLGLDEETVIQKHLAPKLQAKMVHYFQKDGEVTEIQLSENLDIQMQAIHRIFQLHGSYAPKDPREAAQYGVKIIKADIPRPADTFNQFVDVIPETALSRHGVKPTNAAPANGKPPGDKNGHD